MFQEQKLTNDHFDNIRNDYLLNDDDNREILSEIRDIYVKEAQSTIKARVMKEIQKMMFDNLFKVKKKEQTPPPFHRQISIGSVGSLGPLSEYQ